MGPARRPKRPCSTLQARTGIECRTLPIDQACKPALAASRQGQAQPALPAAAGPADSRRAGFPRPSPPGAFGIESARVQFVSPNARLLLVARRAMRPWLVSVHPDLNQPAGQADRGLISL